MAIARLRRTEQVERNREQLLAAARQVFLERGFHAASLDVIAEAAGFSKGVVYSQFASKAELFLALLERRIEERAAENERIAERVGGREGLAELLRAGERRAVAEPAWMLLLTEFRVHAARDPALNQRYTALHARTLERLAATIRRLTGGDGADGSSSEVEALFILAVGTGIALERVVAPATLPSDAMRALAVRALGLEHSATARASRSSGRRTAAPQKAPRPGPRRKGARS